MIVQLGVKECILLARGPEEKDFDRLKIKSILARCDIIATERPLGKWIFGTEFENMY